MGTSSDHIKPLRLFDLGRESGAPMTEQERAHLRDCTECQHIVEVFARQFEKPAQNPKSKSNDAA